MANSYDDNEYVESTINNDLGSTPKITPVEKTSGVAGVGGVNSFGEKPTITSTKEYNYQSKQQEDAAQNEAQLQFTTGVERVRDSEEAKEWVSSKQLYEKTLGVTEYDELRAKLNLRPDESFTDYYNRTNYIPKGFEVQAQLLLAEEKRKKLYVEVQQGNMSEEDFLYEAYGKDLLKEEGIDFSSSLYWYNRYKSGDYSDPRKNNVFMLQVIENARDLFEGETWHEAIQTTKMSDTLAKYVTGEILPTETVAEIFGDAFKQLTEYYDSAEQVIKYYRGGLLQGFNPTIDVDGDGKIDYYYSTNGKLYNVNETGEGANTMKAYYNDDSSLNRIVSSDSYLGEVAGEALKGFAGFFTGVADFIGLLGGLVVDLGEGVVTGDFTLDKTADVSASMKQFWNRTFLGDTDYVVDSGFTTSDGQINWEGIGRQGGRLIGTIGAFVATMGLSSISGGASAAAKGITETGAKAVVKKGLLKLTSGITGTAVRLTGYANGNVASGTLGGILANAATTAMKDSISGAASLTVNKKMLYETGVTDHELTTGEIFGKGLASFGVEFAAGVALRSAVGTQAIDRYAGVVKGFHDKSIKNLSTFMKYSPELLKVTTKSIGKKIAIGAGNMIMDATENIFSAWAQTSYASKGKVLDWESLSSVVSSPSIWLNIVYQTKQNFKDNFSVSAQEIAAATTDVTTLELNAKEILRNAYENADTPEKANLFKQAIDQYDNRIAQCIEETKSATAGSLKAFEELAMQFGWIKESEGFKPQYDKNLDQYIKASENNPVNANIQKCYNTISNLNVQYLEATLTYINNVYEAQQKAATNIFKKAGYKFLYGKDMQNLTTKVLMQYKNVIGNAEQQTAWEAAINDEVFKRTKLFQNNMEELGANGSEALKHIGDGQVAFGRLVKDADGKWKVEDSLAEHLAKGKDNSAFQEYLADVNEQAAKGKINDAMSDIYILTGMTGTAEDGDSNRQDAIKNLHIIKQLFDLVEGDGTNNSNSIVKEYGDTFVIKFYGIGEQLQTVEQVRGMLQTLTAIKMSVYDNSMLDPDMAGQYMRILLSYFTNSPEEASKILSTKNGVNASAQVIDLMLKNKLITYSQAARLIENLNDYLSKTNTDGIKELPTKDFGKQGLLTTNNNQTPDPQDYLKATEILQDIKTIAEAQQVAESISKYAADENKFKSKYKKLSAGERSKLDKASDIMKKDKSYVDLLIKEGIITKDLTKSLNPFTTDFENKGTQENLRQAESSQSLNANRDSILEAMGVLLGMTEPVSDDLVIKYTIDDTNFETTLGKLKTWETFSKFLEVSEAGSEALAILKKKVAKVKAQTKSDTINSLQALDGLLKDFNNQKNATNDQKVVTKSMNTIKNLYRDFMAEAIPSILNSVSNKLDCDTEVFYKPWGQPEWSTLDSKRNTKLSNDYIDKNTSEIVSSPLSFGSLISFIKDHYIQETLTDTYASLDNEYGVLNKYATTINNDTVTIRLNDIMGPETAKVFRKLENEDIRSRVLGKSDNEIISELFTSKKQFYKYKQEQKTIADLKDKFGDEIVIKVKDAGPIFNALGINLSGEILYKGYSEPIAGVYYADGQQGIELGDAKALGKLSQLANTSAKTLKTSKTIFRDPISKADTMASGLNFKSLNDTVTTDINLYPEIKDNSDFISLGTLLEKVASNNKIGKYASQTKEVTMSYVVPESSDTYNIKYQTAVYMYDIINWLDEYCTNASDNKNLSVAPLVIVSSTKPEVDFNKLWDSTIEEKDGLYYTTITPKRTDNFNFKEQAFKLLKDKGLTAETIKQIIPNNADFARTNNVLKEGLGDQTINISQTPAAYISSKLLNSDKYKFDDTFFTQRILKDSNDLDTGKLDLTQYDAATKFLEGKTRQEVLDTNSDNVFIQIKKHEIEYEEHIKQYMLDQLSLWCDRPEEQTQVAKLLFSDEARMNIGQVLNTILIDEKTSTVKPEYLDKDGDLIISDDLITRIKDTIKTTPEIKQIINADSSTALKSYLALLSITSFTKTTSLSEPDSLESKLYAAIRAATYTGSDTLKISYLDLYRLSDEELDKLNPLLKSIGLKEIPKDLLQIIKQSEIRNVPNTNPETLPVNSALAQAEKQEPTYDPSRGFIVSKEDLSNKDTVRKVVFDNKFIDNQIERRKRTRIGNLFNKFAALDSQQQSLHTMALSKGLDSYSKNSHSGVLGYIPYKASLMRANFNYKELEYRFLSNVSDFAIELKRYKFFEHMDDSQLANIALHVYDLTSGTEFEGVHPDYMLVNKDGDIVNISSSNYKDGHYTYDNLVSAILKTGNNIDDISIIHLNRNSMNTTFSGATLKPEVYNLEDNIDLINLMVKQKVESMAYKYNIKPGNRDEAITKTSEYYAEQEMKTPKFYNDLLYSAAKEIGISEDAIQDYITAKENLSFTSRLNTQQEEVFSTITNQEDSEFTNYQLQQLRDIQSYGETENTFYNKEGIKDAIDTANKAILDNITSFKSSDYKKINALLDSYSKNKEEGIAFINSYIKNNKNLKPEFIVDLIKYYIYKQDTIASNLFKISNNSIEDFDLKDKEFSNIPIFKVNSDNTVSASDVQYNIKDIRSRHKLTLDIEQLYNGDTHNPKEHVYQIAYDYDGKEGVVYLGKNLPDNVTDLKKLFPKFFSDYFDKNKGSQESIAELLKHPNTDIGMEEFITIIKQAKQDNALLIGYNSNQFDIPKLLTSSNLKGYDIADLKSLECLDIFELAKRLPTSDNIDHFSNRLQLEKLAEQYGLKIDKEHNAQVDVQNTKYIFNKLLDNAITQDNHHNKFIEDIKDLYKGITGSDLESSTLYKFNLGQNTKLDIVTNMLNYLSKPDKLYNFSKITNILNEKALSDYYNIRKKELDLNIKTHNYKNIVDFATMITKKGNNLKALHLMNFLLDNMPEEVNKDMNTKLINVTKKLKDYFKSKKLKVNELIDVFSDLDRLEEAVLTITGKTIDDLNSDTSTETVESILSQTKNITADSIALDDAAFFTNKALEPFENLLKESIYDSYPTIANEISKRMSDSLKRFYDLPSTKDGQLKVTRVKSPLAINMLSKTQQEIIDWLKTSPILKTTDDSIYELAQTTYNKLKLVNGSKERPKNDTLYMTKGNFQRLMNNMDLDFSTVKDYYGSTVDANGNSELYIPVIRHPRDIADSLHFLKVKLIQDNQGFEVVMNIDTMKTRFNGDFDGDHITILKPQKYLSDYAAITNKYKNSSALILDNVLDSLINNESFNAPYADATLLITKDTNLIKQLQKDLSTLETTKDNYIETYERLKKAFIENETNKSIAKKLFPNKSDKEITSALKDIYLVEPIAIKSTANTTASSYITYTDYFGLSKDNINVRNKDLYSRNSTSQAITLSKFDPTSGMYQKSKLKADMSEFENKINLINKAFTLSPTTLKIIDNNLDSIKSALASNNTLSTSVKDLINSAKSARDIELALRVNQINKNFEMQQDPNFKLALDKLKNSDSDFNRALTAFSSGENNFTEDEMLSKFIYTCEDLVSLADQTKSGFMSKPNNDSLSRLLNYSSKIYEKGIISENGKTLSAMQRRLKNLILLSNEGNKNNIIAEDGFLLLPKMDDYCVVIPKAIKLSDSDMSYMSKYIKSNKGIINETIPRSDKKAYSILGLNNSSSYQVVLGFTDNNILTVYKKFGLGSTKTGVRGWKDTKGVPQGYADINTLPESLREIAKDCAVLRDATFMDTNNILSTFKEYDPEVIKDSNGKPIAIVCDMDQSCLEATPTFTKDVKTKPSDDLDIGNSLLDSGGLWQTKAAFISIDEQGNLVYDDKGHADMMARYAKLNNPYAKPHSAVGVYELLQFSVLSPYITDDMCKDFNCDSKEEYILKCLKLPEGTLRNKIALLKHKINKADITNDIAYKLLFDSKLEAQVYGYTTETSVEGSIKTTKGASRRNTKTQSPSYSESEAGGGIKSLETFDSYPNMSTMDLLNYLNDKDSIKEYNIQRLMQYGYLPVGGYENINVDYSKLSTDSAKIGETIPGITKEMTGPQIYQGVPEDYLTSDIQSKYNSYDVQTGYMSSKDNNPLNRTNKLYTQEANSLILMLKALSPDMDGKFNKYTVLDNLSTGTNRFITSLDPTTLQFANGELKYLPRQYREKSKQLIPIRGDEFVNDLLSMRASPDYYTHKNQETDKINIAVDNADQSYTYHAPDYDQDALVKDFDNLKYQNIKRLSPEDEVAFNQYKRYTYTIEDLNRETSRNNVTYGNKVYKDRKVFEKETIMLNHGIKLKDSDDLNQDRNLKQTAVDMINYDNNYNKDTLKLFNFAQNAGTVEQVNTYVYLLAAQNKLIALDNKYKNAPQSTEYQIEVQNILNSLKMFNINTAKDIDITLDKLESSYRTETYFVKKILTNLKTDSDNYSKLLNLPSNIFMMITNNANPNKKARQSLVQSFKNMFSRKAATSNAPEAKQDQLPLYDSFNFFDSITATTAQIAKSRAIYENSIRLRKSGVIDNTAIHKILLQTINENRQAIETADLSSYKDGLISIIKAINSQFSSYLESTEDGTGTLDKLYNIDYALASNNKEPIGKVALQLFDLLSEISSTLGISYETARTDTTNLSDAAKFISLVEYTQDMFATISALTHDTLVENLVKNISDYAKQNKLSLVDSTGKLIYTDKVLMLHDLDMKAILDEIDKAEVGKVRYLANKIIKGDVYLMDSNLADTYAKTIFKEYKKPGMLMNLIRKSSNLCIKLIMSSPFKLVDRFLKFSAFDAATLGTANIDTFKYEGESFKDLKAYFMSKGSYSSDNLREFLETQGIKMKGDNFNLILNTDNTDSYNLFKSYTDATGKVFTFQTLSQRYAYWLATKEAIKNGDYSKLGSAFHLKDSIKDMDAIVDADGNTRITKEGQQAAFAMSQMLGSSEDFPGLSKTLNNYGFVFTTFPLAAVRWGIGELRSMSSAVKGLFTEGIRSDNAKWLLQNTSGLITTFIAERVLIGLICDMFGVTDEEDEEEWKEKGALPNMTQSIIQGQPIMDTFSSMSPLRELYELTLEPVVGSKEGSSLSGLQKFLYKNIVGHINPIIKNVGEVVTKKDLIDDQLIDTEDKYSGFENVFRKLSSYIIGASGANAMARALHEDKSLSGLAKGFNNAIAAEMGNTKAQKENQKNYYDMISLVNSYRDYDNNTYASSGNFNYNNYSQVKSKIYNLINKRASSTEVYAEINNLLKQGFSYYEIRSALKNCSLSYKLEKIDNYNEFFNSLLPNEIQNLKTALAYEEYMFPWIDDSVNTLTNTINQNKSNKYGYLNLYNARPKQYAGTYTRPDYSLPKSYNTYNNNKYPVDPYDAYSSMQKQQAYNKRQADYKRRQQQYKENK